MSKEKPLKKFKKNINHMLELDQMIERYATENDLTLIVITSLAKPTKNGAVVTGSWINYGNKELEKPLVRGVLEIVKSRLES
ncbi:hypothetical protein ACE193_15405 [Bernardetia sp. OM2101]|uniref:hypothetical protein n=1 Tax=Bernardetia sp. OM2101 TaxID=3344876 RepID=UPI0035CF1AA5